MHAFRFFASPMALGLLLVAVGCGPRAVVANESPDQPQNDETKKVELDDPVATQCLAEKQVKSAEEIRALLLGYWADLQADNRRVSIPSPDFYAAAKIVLDQNDIALPRCDTWGPPCAPDNPVLFAIAADPGALPAIVAKTQLNECNRTTRLVIPAGARFRLSLSRESFSDCTGMNAALISVSVPCGDPCPGTHQRCAKDLVCYERGRDWCLYCDRLSAPQCGCVTASGYLPEGAACYYAESGDLLVNGVCTAQRCQRD